MQTVWSRVAQAGATCRCASCTVKTSVTRHSATAAGKRPTRYLTTSTLLYSGIFAVAASTDALIKEKRRKQWDEAIESAKAGVEQARVRLQALEEETKQHHGMKSRDEDAVESFLDEAELTYENPRTAPQGSPWPESGSNDFEQGNFAPQSIWASETFQNGGRARHFSPKKLRLTALAVDELTVRVLLQLDRQALLAESLEETYTEDFRRLVQKPQSQLSNLQRRLRQSFRATKALDAHATEVEFASNPGALANYSHDVDSHHVEDAGSVEREIRRILKQQRQGKLTTTQMILHTLHSLVTSTAPPTLETWNSLLHACNKQHLSPGFSYEIIRAMRISYVRMNEHSLVGILEHYIRINDHSGFCRWVEIMQGMHGGLCLARPDIRITDRSQGRLIPVTDNGERKIIQKPVANPVVLTALVQGVLHFDGFDAALEMLQSTGLDGWGLSMKGLTPLLRDCARRANWDAGVAVWEQIKRVQALSRRRGHPELIQSWTYATMLQLCVACGMKAEFSTIMSEAVRMPNMTRSLLVNQVKKLNSALQADLEREGQTLQAQPVLNKLRWRRAEELASAPLDPESTAVEAQLVANAQDGLESHQVDNNARTQKASDDQLAIETHVSQIQDALTAYTEAVPDVTESSAQDQALKKPGRVDEPTHRLTRSVQHEQGRSQETATPSHPATPRWSTHHLGFGVNQATAFRRHADTNHSGPFSFFQPVVESAPM